MLEVRLRQLELAAPGREQQPDAQQEEELPALRWTLGGREVELRLDAPTHQVRTRSAAQGVCAQPALAAWWHEV